MGGISKTGLAVVIGIALLMAGLTFVVPILYLVIGIVVILVLLGVLMLLASKTAFGRRGAMWVGVRVARTRLGRRMARAQLRATAKRQGIPLVDPLGRELSDVELQLELDDSPQGQALKRQLKAMNPQRRAEAMRMLEAQADALARGETMPDNLQQPRAPGFSGRPQTRPPRTTRKNRKRR
jgi:hypothetical protein